MAVLRTLRGCGGRSQGLGFRQFSVFRVYRKLGFRVGPWALGIESLGVYRTDRTSGSFLQ